MYGENKDCPIRITCIVSESRIMVDKKSETLIKEFGWKHHSYSTSQGFSTPGDPVFLHSRILFHDGNKT